MGNTITPGDIVSTGRIELAEVTGVEYATAIQERRGLAGLALFPAHYPFPNVPDPLASMTTSRPGQQRPRLPRGRYATIAERAQHESLRDLALACGVSHETIRAIVHRADRARLAVAAAD